MAAKNSGATMVTLPSDREIVITREFDAPRALVFEASTKCEHLKRWWGPRALPLAQCEIDLRPGGAYRFVQRAANGEEYGFRGVYREIVPPERLVYTFIFEPMPQHEAIVTLLFEEQDGRTKMTDTILHASREARDGHLRSGMEGGMRETLDRLEELLATLVHA